MLKTIIDDKIYKLHKFKNDKNVIMMIKVLRGHAVKYEHDYETGKITKAEYLENLVDLIVRIIKDSIVLGGEK